MKIFSKKNEKCVTIRKSMPSTQKRFLRFDLRHPCVFSFCYDVAVGFVMVLLLPALCSLLSALNVLLSDDLGQPVAR